MSKPDTTLREQPWQEICNVLGWTRGLTKGEREAMLKVKQIVERYGQEIAREARLDELKLCYGNADIQPRSFNQIRDRIAELTQKPPQKETI